jgi:hypothetical protein
MPPKGSGQPQRAHPSAKSSAISARIARTWAVVSEWGAEASWSLDGREASHDSKAAANAGGSACVAGAERAKEDIDINIEMAPGYSKVSELHRTPRC